MPRVLSLTRIDPQMVGSIPDTIRLYLENLFSSSKQMRFLVCNSTTVSNTEQVRALADVIALSALEGLDQFYEAYLSFTSIFAYQHPEICVALAEGLPEILATPPELVDKGQWSSACESLGNTAAAAGSAGKTDLRDRITAAGVAFATALGSKPGIRSFDARAVAKMLLFARMPAEALDVIMKIPSEASTGTIGSYTARLKQNWEFISWRMD